jgi:hypothetical protein
MAPSRLLTMLPEVRRRWRSPGRVLVRVAFLREGLVLVPITIVAPPLFPIIRTAVTRLAGGLARKLSQIPLSRYEVVKSARSKMPRAIPAPRDRERDSTSLAMRHA